MKKIIITCLVLFQVVLFQNCQNPENARQEALKKEVFVIHDDVMPKTAEINRIQRKLRAVIKEDTTLDADSKKNITLALLQLERAHDSMMVWMNNFKSPAKLRSSRSHEEILEYLEGEKLKIEQVRDSMLNSIEVGNQLLNSLDKKQ